MNLGKRCSRVLRPVFQIFPIPFIFICDGFPSCIRRGFSKFESFNWRNEWYHQTSKAANSPPKSMPSCMKSDRN